MNDKEPETSPEQLKQEYQTQADIEENNKEGNSIPESSIENQMQLESFQKEEKPTAEENEILSGDDDEVNSTNSHPQTSEGVFEQQSNVEVSKENTAETVPNDQEHVNQNVTENLEHLSNIDPEEQNKTELKQENEETQGKNNAAIEQSHVETEHTNEQQTIENINQNNEESQPITETDLKQNIVQHLLAVNDGEQQEREYEVHEPMTLESHEIHEPHGIEGPPLKIHMELKVLPLKILK